MEDVILKSFPKSAPEFLASLWLQQQDLKGKSPVEISDMYDKALSEIKEKYVKIQNSHNKPAINRRGNRSSGIDI